MSKERYDIKRITSFVDVTDTELTGPQRISKSYLGEKYYMVNMLVDCNGVEKMVQKLLKSNELYVLERGWFYEKS